MVTIEKLNEMKDEITLELMRAECIGDDAINRWYLQGKLKAINEILEEMENGQSKPLCTPKVALKADISELTDEVRKLEDRVYNLERKVKND